MDFEEVKEKILSELDLNDLNSGVFYGEWASVEGRDIIESRSPINNNVIAKVGLATKEDYEKVISYAQDVFKEWANIPPPARGEIVRDIVDELMRYKKALGLLVTLEVGKTITEGQGEVQEMIDIGNFAVGLSRQLHGLTIASERKDHRLYEQWHPLGPIGVITAFNFPTAVWSWNALIASVVGDTVIWKPSTKAPLCGIAVTKIVNKILEKKGIPPIFLLTVGKGGTVGDFIAKDSRIPLVSFTGSVKTGKIIAENVARRLGKVILELGGNNAAIVTKNADTKIALKGVAFGALATAGQRCTTTRRLILHKDIYDEFLRKLIEIYKNVKIGNPLEKDTLVGPLIDEDALLMFEKAVKQAIDEGGKVVYGGKRCQVPGLKGGCYAMPTIIEARPDMKIVREETFAPILYVMKFRNLEEAIEIHNNVPQGLSSAIFTTDLHEAEYFLSHRGSDCGIANVNTSTAGAEIGGAFGGEKETGGGREAGSDAWKFYARRQTVTINYGYELPLAQGVKFKV
jgi:aldehyde dehydrogenase (NAD+)